MDIVAVDPAPTLSSDDEDDAQDLMHLPVIIHRQKAPRPPQEGCVSKKCDTQTALEKMSLFASCLMHASHRPQAGGRAVAPGKVAVCCAFQFASTGRAVAGSLRQSVCLGTGEYMLTASTCALAYTSSTIAAGDRARGACLGGGKPAHLTGVVNTASGPVTVRDSGAQS